MPLFPMFTDLSNQICIIFGGGNVALRKIRSLDRYGAGIRVIAEEIRPEIREMVPDGNCHKIRLEAAGIEKFLADAALVVAATDSREINHRIAACCHDLRIPVNVADAPEECTFVFPAVVTRGEISIGINSGSFSPGISKKIRQRIEEIVPESYGEIAHFLGDLRARIRDISPEEAVRREILREAATVSFEKDRPLTQEEISDIISLRCGKGKSE